MNVKYQIFVSSTYEDLKAERAEVIKACLNMGHIPVGMEMFNAADEEQWAVITRTIDQCDYYVVIVAHRYGSTTADGISFTEKEYDYAVAHGMPVLGFVIDNDASWPSKWVEREPSAVEALQRFRSKVKQKMVRAWRDQSELQAHFAISLSTTITINPRRGWVRSPERGDTDIAQTLSNLTDENARLRKELLDLQSAARQGSDTDAILAMLKRLKIQQVRAGNPDSLIHGDILFPLVAKNIRSGNFPKVIETVFPSVQPTEINEFTNELLVLGLLEKPSSIKPFVLTPMGSVIYARLLAD